MRITKELALGEQVVTVKELTLSEIRGWLAEGERSGERDVVDALLLDDCPLDDLLRFCSATPDELDRLTQSELRELVAEVKELNPDFFGLRSKLLRLVVSAGKSSSSAPLQA